MGKQNFIEINGKKYDTVTGKLISGAPSISSPVLKIKPNGGSGIVDGFSRRNVKNTRSNQLPNPISKQPQKSKTLMRSAVSKPTPKKLPQVHKQTIRNVPQLNKFHTKVSEHRALTAQSVSKSPHIQKFNHAETHRTSIAKTHAVLPIKLPPVRVVAKPTVETAHSGVSRQASHTMIESALKNAKSHEEVHIETKKKPKRSKLAKKLGISRKLAGLSSGALAVVLLAGFFAIQNVPNLSMKVAATRAGFNATMPGYKPSGFSFKGPINYSTGQVTVSFQSNNDGRSYQFVQQSSSWNSDALVANFLEPEGKQFQTYLDKGRTLYIYDNSNATWVDDGVWYKIEGNSSMTSDQLIRIVNSV